MTMGNVMSRLAMILRRKKVTPNQIQVTQRNLSHERCDERERPRENNEPETQQRLKSVSDIEVAAVEQYGEVSSVLGSSEFGESSQPTRTDTLDIVNYKTGENDCTDGFCPPEQDSEIKVSSNDTKSVQNKRLLCVQNKEKEALSPTGHLIENSDDLRDILNPGISTENILNIRTTTDPDYYSSGQAGANCLSQDINEQGEKLDSFSWISKDGYSTEGTVGSGSFGDRDDDIIDRLLVDNIDDLGIDYGKFDEVRNGRNSSLTPLSLETLNSNELDKRECVRSYIQAWSPLNLPTTGAYSNSLPGSCADVGLQDEPTSSASYERFRTIYEDLRSPPNEPRELHEVDSQEFCLFYQREPEPVSRPLSDSCDLLKNNRAPWINIGSEVSEEVAEGREGFIGDDQDTGWPKARADTWQDPNKGLTICSLSTINEESDDADRIDHL